MSGQTVLIFGAGATAACGGPTTEQLLPAFLEYAAQSPPDRDSSDEITKKVIDFVAFLHECFHLDVDDHWKVPKEAVFPSLPLLLSLVDMALDRGQPLGAWDADRLASLKIATQAVILTALFNSDAKSAGAKNPYERLLEPYYREGGTGQPIAITLNYDAVLDKAMVKLGSTAALRVPDYGCDVVIETKIKPPRFGRLLKLHGSLNWVYCRRCSRLALHMAELTEKTGDWSDWFDFLSDFVAADTLDKLVACPRCGGRLGPLLITPSTMKDYRNPHVSRIWYEAEQALRDAGRVVFVGYSLPWDDVEVIYLLKQALDHLPPERITVVEYNATGPVSIDKHDAGRRYLSVFGQKVDWRPLGFGGWLDDCERRGVAPIDMTQT